MKERKALNKINLYKFMAEVINAVFDANKKFVDFAGLDHFWALAKDYVNAADKAIDDKVVALADVVGDSSKGLVKDLADVRAELNALGDVEGGQGIGGMIDAKIAALDLANTYEAKGAAEDALEAAKEYADGLDGLMDARVADLEAIDHAKLAADASAAAVATVLDGAPEKFDTLKEVAQWIADSESAATAADLVTRVGALEAINHEAYVAADTALETSLKGYTDTKVEGVRTAAQGMAASAGISAEAEAKKYTDAEIAKLSFDNAGAAAQALIDAKAYADGLAGNYDAAGAAATAKSEAIAKAAEDAATMLASYYTKSEVDGLLSSADTAAQGYATAAQGAAEAYAKTYTDALFTSFVFASNDDIDGLFAAKAE